MSKESTGKTLSCCQCLVGSVFDCFSRRSDAIKADSR
jgi:hypothetical protein